MELKKRFEGNFKCVDIKVSDDLEPADLRTLPADSIVKHIEFKLKERDSLCRDR